MRGSLLFQFIAMSGHPFGRLIQQRPKFILVLDFLRNVFIPLLPILAAESQCFRQHLPNMGANFHLLIQFSLHAFQFRQHGFHVCPKLGGFRSQGFSVDG